MTVPSTDPEKVLNIYITLAQFPTLRDSIRARMRRELFDRGVITPQQFEAEVHERSIESQAREGLHNPPIEEPAEVSEARLTQIRGHLTDFYFSSELPSELFEQILRDVLPEHAAQMQYPVTHFNPELAPYQILFELGLALEAMPGDQREPFQARLQEIKVILIRRIISDQLAYNYIARERFRVDDLIEIEQRKIGRGKIGGKAAGMLLARRILMEEAGAEIDSYLRIPESYFLGSDLMSTFTEANDLVHWSYQKYQSEEQIRAAYPLIQKEFMAGKFPTDILDQLLRLLQIFGNQPLIVRSSSLLEDTPGVSFAGLYETVFCPNQGSDEKNLFALCQAIQQVYSSVCNPDALLYRSRTGLLDYDEQMAILIQKVEGHPYEKYYFPTLAGVALSRNPYRWTPRIRREDGLVRLVWGLGTRAVKPLTHDFPRLISLSHPHLRPEKSTREVWRYSQHAIDLIDLESNLFKTLPIQEVLGSDYPSLTLIASYLQDDEIRSFFHQKGGIAPQDMLITFDGLLQEPSFVAHLKSILKILEVSLNSPVAVEFTAEMPAGSVRQKAQICLLQCRPLGRQSEAAAVQIPEDIPGEDILFTAHRMIPQGVVRNIRYVVFVDPKDYVEIEDRALKLELARTIGRLNESLANQPYILIGPGRWGSRDVDLGVGVNFADIYNARMLVEMSIGTNIPPSYGTHFFQDLVEVNIYSLPIFPNETGDMFDRSFFLDAPNVIQELLPVEAKFVPHLKVIDVPSIANGRVLHIIMDGEHDKALGFLAPEAPENTERKDIL
jgi:hypothetical protein